MTSDVVGQGTAADPWVLKTPPGTSDYAMHKDEASPATPGVHRGQDHAVLPAPVPPGPSRDAARARRLDGAGVGRRAQKPAKEGTVEAWGRSESNPVGGWYGLKKGLRGRFGMYIPPLMEALGLAELEHNPRNNRMRAI